MKIEVRGLIVIISVGEDYLPIFRKDVKKLIEMLQVSIDVKDDKVTYISTKKAIHEY